MLRAEIASDGELLPQEFSRANADALRDGGPWGQGYPEPLFDGEFELLNWRVVGERHLKLELAHAGGRLNAIAFGGWNGEAPGVAAADRVSAGGRRVSRWRRGAAGRGPQRAGVSGSA